MENNSNIDPNIAKMFDMLKNMNLNGNHNTNQNNNNGNNNNTNNNMNDFNMMQIQMQYMMMMNNGMFSGINNNPNKNNTSNNIEITINVHLDDEKVVQVKFSQDEKIEELIKKIKNENNISKFFKLMVNGKPLVNSLTLAENNLGNGSNVRIIFMEDRNDDKTGYIKPINMIFKMNKSNKSNDNDSDLDFISKVCYLKEIVSRLSDENLEKFPEEVSIILKLLKKGNIKDVDNLEDESKELLEKIRQTNLLNLAHYIDKAIDSNQIKNMLNLLDKGDLNEIKEFKNNLLKIREQIIMFDKDFALARRKSVFEYSLVSLKIIDRSDIDNYKNASNNCPNKNERILYYGTSEQNISNILTNHFQFYPKNLFGKGVYLTNSLNLSHIYSNESLSNNLKLPKINEEFSLVISSVFYNNETRKRVMDNKYSPKKNEVNIAMVDGKLNPIKDSNKSKFYSREYIIGDSCQIFPFMHIKIKRNEYCVIWRDNNLSPKPVYNDEYDEEFKAFLKDRLEYISQYAKFNIYPCETTEEALSLVRKKKFNKIILMSNVGTDLGGKAFVDEARKIIGNDVITLFLAYMEEHLEWITQYNNSLFSNIDQFHEQYLECFTDDINTTKQNILTLKNSIEDHYEVKFKFDDKFLDFPNFKEDGEYDELNF